MAKLSLCFQSILIPTERLSERRNRMRMKRDILIIVNARGGWYAWIIPREIVLFEFFSGCDMKNTIPSHPFESAFVLFIWNLQTHRTNCVLRETKFLSFSATVSQCFSLEKKNSHWLLRAIEDRRSRRIRTIGKCESLTQCDWKNWCHRRGFSVVIRTGFPWHGPSSCSSDGCTSQKKWLSVWVRLFIIILPHSAKHVCH